MYCIKCGVRLEDTEKQCPLCGTVPYHPELARENKDPSYPTNYRPEPTIKPLGLSVILTVLFVIPFVITLMCDININDGVTWSPYVIGALIVGYTGLVLPSWFSRPNPVIFFPTFMATVGGYLLFISLYSDGGWFMSFAFPITLSVTVIITAVIALVRYVRTGHLYIAGGAVLAFAALMPVIELLVMCTFDEKFVGWSLYPAVTFLLVGGAIIFFAICKPARESIEKKIFF